MMAFNRISWFEQVIKSSLIECTETRLIIDYMILMSWFMGCDLLSHGEDCVLFSAGFTTFCCQY